MKLHVGDLWNTNLREHQSLLEKVAVLEPELEKAANLLTRALGSDGKVMLCGNGGSAADAQHIAAEFTGRFIEDRRPLAALALHTDTSALTCISNDYSYADVFARQLQALGRAGDALVAISTSGNSPNVLKAAQAARAMGISVVGLLGRDGGAIKPLCDVAIVVPSASTARIQEMHILIGHTLCGAVEQMLGLVPRTVDDQA
jgi:D-sedoheptulose 7-phosphate isomerase